MNTRIYIFIIILILLNQKSNCQNCLSSDSLTFTKDSIVKIILNDLKGMNLLKDKKIYNFHLDQKSVIVDSFNFIFYEIVIGFGKSRNEYNTISIPVVECYNTKKTCYNLKNVNKKTVYNVQFFFPECSNSILIKKIQDRFLKGAIVSKRKTFIHLIKRTKSG